MPDHAAPSAELPAIAAVDAGDKRSHRLISAPRLHLVVLRLALPALATLKLVCCCLHDHPAFSKSAG